MAYFGGERQSHGSGRVQCARQGSVWTGEGGEGGAGNVDEGGEAVEVYGNTDLTKPMKKMGGGKFCRLTKEQTEILNRYKILGNKRKGKRSTDKGNLNVRIQQRTFLIPFFLDTFVPLVRLHLFFTCLFVFLHCYIYSNQIIHI